MKDMKILTPNAWYGNWTTEGIWEEKDGRHFCLKCNKLIKIGQKVQEHSSLAFRRRALHFSYTHVKCEKN